MGQPQGKLTNAVNSYCINIVGDWKICGKCHVGRGLRPDDSQAGMANVDCLSLSGQKVGRWTDLWLTQWPSLAQKDGPRFEGSVL